MTILLKKIKFNNFELFEMKEVKFSSGINLIPYRPNDDDNSLDLFFKIFLNPQKSMNSGLDLFNILHSRYNNKEDFSIDFELNSLVNQDNLRGLSSEDEEFYSAFLNSDAVNVKIKTTKVKPFSIELQNLKGNWVELSPNYLRIWNNVITNAMWIDQQFCPYFDLVSTLEFTHFSPADLFDFILSLCNLKSLREQYQTLMVELNYHLNDFNKFNDKLHVSQLTKQDLEQKLDKFNQITEIDKKLEDIKAEISWNPYFEGHNKINNLTNNISRLTKKTKENQINLVDLQDKLDKLLSSIDQLITKREELKANYEKIRKDFLSEKHLLDQNERNLKEWDSSIKKIEREIKYATMKLKDKNKKLHEIVLRLEKSENPSQFKEEKLKLEEEIAKVEKENKNRKERLNALKSEKNRKMKDKSIKEKKILPLTTQLNLINEKLSKADNLLKRQKFDLNNISDKKLSLEQEITKSLEEKDDFESELDLQKKDHESIKLKTNNLQSKKPVEGRSIHVLNTIKQNLIRQKNELKSSINGNNIKEKYI